MRAHFHHYFDKRFAKLPIKVQQKASLAIQLFSDEPFNPALHNHALTGKYLGFRSIDITGNYRAVFKLISDNVALFTDIGTHSQLYR